MSKINWYVGMPVYIVGYTECKVYTMDVGSNECKPIEIECKLNNGELRYLDCTIDGRTDANMETQNVFFEPIEIPESAKRPKRWRAEKKELYYAFDMYNEVAECLEYNDDDDSKKYAAGNYFRTREDAEAMAEKIKNLLMEGL